MAGMIPTKEGFFVWGANRSLEQYGSLSDDLEKMQSLDLEKASTSDIRRTLNAVAAGYLTLRMTTVARTSFRCRRETDPENLWTHVRQLWAPQASPKVKVGRFNQAGKPVLYFSGDPFTALAEVQPEPKEYCTLLVLKQRNVDHRLRMVQLGVEKLPKVPVYDRALGEVRLGLSEEPGLKALLAQRGTREYWLQQNDFLTDVCTKVYTAEESPAWYRLTYLIGEQLMKTAGVVGIQFPSVANYYNGANTMMPVRFAAPALDPVEVWLVALDDRVDPFGIYQSARVVRRAAVDDNGNLHWGSHGSWWPHDLHLEIAPLDPPTDTGTTAGLR
jgi:hypothetical protein